MYLSSARLAAIATFALVIINVAIADDLTIPNTFQAGTPARAADVNANFTAVEASVDDNAADVLQLQQSAFTWMGTWQNGVTYSANDLVEYQGSTYLAVQDTAGTQNPSDAAFWSLFAAAGADGTNGQQGPAGDTGATGSQGADGPQGPQGIQGQQGLQGNVGPQGPQGDQGPAGADLSNEVSIIEGEQAVQNDRIDALESNEVTNTSNISSNAAGVQNNADAIDALAASNGIQVYSQGVSIGQLLNFSITTGWQLLNKQGYVFQASSLPSSNPDYFYLHSYQSQYRTNNF